MKTYRTRAPLPYRPAPAFFQFADPVVQSRRTLLGYDRLYVLWQAVLNVAAVDGLAVEVGAYRGGSAHFLANAFEALAGAVPLIVIDTFTGHPISSVGEQDPDQAPGHFDHTSYDDVRAYLSGCPRVSVQAGDACTLVPQLPDQRYRLVHLDTDLYKPTAVCLQYFGARLSPGGIIVIDDYSSGRCAGVAQATTEYLAHTRGRFQVWDCRTEQLVLVRSGEPPA